MAPSLINRESQPKLTTWLFEEGTFVPMAKFVGKHSYSIACDYLGLPIMNPNRSLECLFFAKASTTDEEEQIAKSKYLMTDLSK